MAVVQNVNLNSLRVFAIAARHGNFQRAAEELNISHGAVSQRIKQLELDLGVMLFERKPRGVSLTRIGERYYTAVKEALAIIATAATEVEDVSRQVTLHIGPSTASKWLMPRLNAFATKHPDVSLSTEVHEELLARNLGRNEIAIWPGKATGRNPAHHVRCLTELQLVAVCSPDLPRPDGTLDVAALISLPLLQDSHRRWDLLINTSGHRAKRSILNFGSSALALDAAINGHGIAIAPTYIIEKDIHAGRLTKVWNSPESSKEFLYVSWAKQNADEKPLRRTLNWILSEFGLDASV